MRGWGGEGQGQEQLVQIQEPAAAWPDRAAQARGHKARVSVWAVGEARGRGKGWGRGADTTACTDVRVCGSSYFGVGFGSLQSAARGRRNPTHGGKDFLESAPAQRISVRFEYV